MYTFLQDGSCHITERNLPRPWYNYLFNQEGYCCQISHVGKGESYYLDAKANMCHLNVDNARYLYIRNNTTGAYAQFWEGEQYQCIHHPSYTEISSVIDQVKIGAKFFVPPSGLHEVWCVSLENLGTEEKNLSLFSLVSFEMEGFSYPRYSEMYRSCETSYSQELQGVYLSSRHPLAPHGHYNGYVCSAKPVDGYDGDLAPFLGGASVHTRRDCSQSGAYEKPYIVASNLDCTGSETANFMLGGVLQNNMKLQSGEVYHNTYTFGVAESLEEVCDISKMYQNARTVEDVLSETIQAHAQRYKGLSVKTPSTQINTIYNGWLKKQIDFCLVGKKGVRDNAQISLGMLNFLQERAKTEILEILKHQFQEGHCVLTWFPYDDTRYSDQPVWLIFAVCELIKETGDTTILDISIEYQDGGCGAVAEHLERAVERLASDVGPHGLCKIFFADWNDALNIHTDPEAESVMLSAQFCLALKELSQLQRFLGNYDKEKELLNHYERVKEALNTYAWDGDHYVRALTKDGPIGSVTSDGSKIFLNAQVWAVLAGVCEGERLTKTLASIDSMEHEFGFPLNLPPYAEYSDSVGRMSSMLPGLYENGGVYCHATGFKVYMDSLIGRGEHAVRGLEKILPDSTYNPSSRSGAEPYVFTNCYSTHKKYYGKSYQSWTTGTSAWGLITLFEGILGIQRGYDGLNIKPAFPKDWQEASVTREFRGCTYHIQYKRVSDVAFCTTPCKSITVEGKELGSYLLPLGKKGEVFEVVVQI